MMDAIVVNSVSKSYGKVQALSDVSFSVGKGEVFGLIGPDGAGKTSMFRILCSLLLPDAGTATVDGYDVVKQMREVRSRTGYMPGKFSLYQDLTIEENLKFFATLFGTKDTYISAHINAGNTASDTCIFQLSRCSSQVHSHKVRLLSHTKPTAL